MAVDSFEPLKETKEDGIQSFAFIIAASICVLFCVSFAVSGLGKSAATQRMEMENRINPNDAPPASLVRLPGIGIRRAQEIVAYRKDFSKRTGNSRAFETYDDLQKVKGIGPKTIRNIDEWLKFE